MPFNLGSLALRRGARRRIALNEMIPQIFLALVGVAITTIAIAITNHFVDLGRVGIIYLLPVFIAAILWGLIPALIAALASAGCSAFFFYPPIYSFQAHDWNQQVDLALFTFVAIVASHLASRLKRQAEVDRLREALIGSVSHELRTPLASILGAASVIGETPKIANDERLAPLANMIRDEAERLNHDIQNLLDATRISSEGISPKLEAIDPADIVNTSVEKRQRRLAGHRIEIDVSDDLPFMTGDSILIEQALGQILANAAKYSPPGSTIRIVARHENPWVVLSVIDEGAGLTEQESVRLWERFYRSERHASTTPGSGLGLWIAHAFVTACGGRIDAESVGIGHGTTVSIRLPVEPQTDEEMLSKADA